MGPNTARINYYLISRIDSNNHLVATGNGLYASIDNGNTWVKSITLGGMEVTTIAEVDTVQPQYFCGTTSGKIFTSSNIVEWSLFTDSLPQYPVKTIVLENDTPLSLLVVCNGIFRMSQSGAETRIHTYPSFEDLLIDPNNSQILYAAGNYNVGIYKSTNAGLDWSLMNTGLTNRYVRALAFHPTDTTKIYAATKGGIFYSSNSAVNWQARNSGLTELDSFDITPNPSDPLVLYVGTFGGGLFKTSNGATSWIPNNAGLVNTFLKVISINPDDSNHVVCGTYSGLFQSLNAGQTWSEVFINARNAYLMTLTASETSPFYAGLYGGALYSSNDHGVTWSRMTTPWSELSISAFAVSTMNDSVLYAGTEENFNGGLYISTNGGLDWVQQTNGLPGNAVYEIAPSPLDSQFILLGNGVGLYKSSDGGDTWTIADSSLPASTVQAVQFHPTNSAIIFAGFWGEGLYRSNNSGNSWSLYSNGLTNFNIMAIAFAASSSSTMFVGTWGGGVFRSYNGGRDWQQCDTGIDNLDVFDIKTNPDLPSILYFSTYRHGIFKSSNGGISWQQLNNNLNNLYVRNLLIDPDDPSIILAGTYGDGVQLYQDSLFSVPELSFIGFLVFCFLFSLYLKMDKERKESIF